jgi:DNA-directed RNA polymerase specialized sigma24 family protein
LGTREDVTLLRQYLTWLWETARAVIKREGLADDLVREPLPEAYARWKAPELFEQTARAFYRILAHNASTNQ